MQRGVGDEDRGRTVFPERLHATVGALSASRTIPLGGEVRRRQTRARRDFLARARGPALAGAGGQVSPGSKMPWLAVGISPAAPSNSLLSGTRGDRGADRRLLVQNAVLELRLWKMMNDRSVGRIISGQADRCSTLPARLLFADQSA